MKDRKVEKLKTETHSLTVSYHSSFFLLAVEASAAQSRSLGHTSLPAITLRLKWDTCFFSFLLGPSVFRVFVSVSAKTEEVRLVLLPWATPLALSCLFLSPSLYFLLPHLLKVARVQADERPISIPWRLQRLWESSGEETVVGKANTGISISILKFGSGAVLTVLLLPGCHLVRWWCVTF